MSIDLALHRIRILLSHLPTYRRPTCHIAGTNGKGSVSAILSSILLASEPPLSVGRFNSPHLVSILDSIVINNKPVTSDMYAEARREVERVNSECQVGASNFELLTSTALMIFEKAALDVVVMEVGMGGRLDATNAISDECVLVSALTAVDLDHQAFLGGSISAITTEKVGISRRGKPFVLGRQTHKEVDDIVRGAVAQVGGDLIIAKEVSLRDWNDYQEGRPSGHISSSDVTFEETSRQPVTVRIPCFDEPVHAQLPLHGDHQLANLEVATSIVSELVTHRSCTHLGLRGRVTPASVAYGIQATVWPGRLSFQTFTVSNGKQLRVLVDGAHNSSSALTLSRYISNLLLRVSERTERPLRFNLTYILGLSHSPPKTPLDVLEPLFTAPHFPNVDVKLNVVAIGFTTPEGMPWVKPVPAAEILRVVDGLDANVRSLIPGSQLGHESEIHGALVADFYRALSLGGA